MKKRLTSLLIVLCLVLALVPAALAVGAADFTDVPRNEWCWEYIDEVSRNGYMVGLTDTQFGPYTPMTRAMFVAVLARMDGAIVDNSRTAFADVPVDQYFTGAVTWAQQNGIVYGVDATHFEPYRNVTRVEMAQFLSRYITYYSAKTGDVPAVTGVSRTLTDLAGLNADQRNSVDKCVSWGLIAGYPDKTFRPNNTINRAEIATVISQMAWVTGLSSTSTFKVTYHSNYPDGTDTTFTLRSRLFAEPDVVNIVAPAGYEFDGWNTMKDGSGERFAPRERVRRNIEVYAQWKAVLADHINEAMKEAVTYADGKAKNLYNDALAKLEGLGSATLNKVIANAKAVTSFGIALNDHEVTVTLSTDANDQNVLALARFAYNYVLDTFRSSDASAKDDAKELTNRLKEHIKSLLQSLGIDYQGDGMSEKIETAAKSLAEKAKGIANGIKADLKDIFKNVDANALEEIVDNGTTSVTAAAVTANGNPIITLTKDTALNRKTLEEAAQKLHEVIQKATGDAYASIDAIAGKVTGIITFTPAAEIADNYNGLYSPVYTVKVVLTTETKDYLAYKYDGQHDHFKFSPTSDMWETYVNQLKKLRTQVSDMLKGKGSEAASYAAPVAYGLRSTDSLMQLNTPVPAADPAAPADGEKMSLVDMIEKIDEAFKKLHNNDQDTTVKDAMKEWKDDNKANLTENDMIDILIGEKELDTDGLKNDAIMDLLDTLVEEVAGSQSVKDKVVTNRDQGWSGDELEEFLKSVKLPEDSKEIFDAAEQFGMTGYMYDALADEFNKTNQSQDPKFLEKKAQVEADRASQTGDLENVVKQAIKDQMEDPAGLKEFGNGYLDVNIDEIIKEKFGEDVDFDAIVKALQIFDDLMNPEKLPEKTLGGLVDEMGTEVIKKVLGDRWANYSGRVESIFGRIDRVVTRLLNTRYGDTIEGATIKIGDGNELDVADLKALLEGKYDTYNDLVTALDTFVNTTAKIESLSLGSLGTTLITVHAGSYTYSFYVEVDLSNVSK